MQKVRLNWNYAVLIMYEQSTENLASEVSVQIHYFIIEFTDSAD